MKTKLILIVALIITIILSATSVYAQEEYDKVEAKVIEDKGTREVQQENGIIQKEQRVQVRILEGEYENEEQEMNYIISENINAITSNIELKEDDIIVVSIEEKDGEVISINYRETVNRNYGIYIILSILIISAIVIAKKNAIKPLIVFIFTILLIVGTFILAIIQRWNLILISSIVSLFVTIVIAIKINGINKKTGVMISCSIVGTAIAGILIYIMFDIMKLSNVNIKIVENFINIKDIFVTTSIIIGGLLSNIIVLSSLNMFNFLNKPYKTKSDNIIEGQRSLKL